MPSVTLCHGPTPPAWWDNSAYEPAAAVASSHTTGRIEIVGRVSGRRRWTVEQKLAILRDAFGPDGSVRTTVERHEVGSGAITSGGVKLCRVH